MKCIKSLIIWASTPLQPTGCSRSTNHNINETTNQIVFNEELIRHINLYLNERNINSIVSHKLDKIIVLIEYPTFEDLNILNQNLSQLFKTLLATIF